MQSMFLVWGSPEKNHRLRGFVLTVWLSFCIQLTAGQVSISPPVQDVAVGETATLSVRATVTVAAFNWYRGTGTEQLNRILNYKPRPPAVQTPGPQYTGQEKVLSNGGLEIRNLLKNYTGNYTVQIVLQSDLSTRQATAQLIVCGALPPSDTRCSCWEVTLGAASGVVLGAAFIIIGLVIFYERRLRKAKGQTTTENYNRMQEPATFNENMKKGLPGQPSVQSSGADSIYTVLQHGDQATYGHLKRF